MLKKYLEDQRAFVNAPSCIELSTLNAVVGAASKVEVLASHENARKGIPRRIILMELDHPHHKTPLELDNSTSRGVLTNTPMPTILKAIDMECFWFKDR